MKKTLVGLAVLIGLLSSASEIYGQSNKYVDRLKKKGDFGKEIFVNEGYEGPAKISPHYIEHDTLDALLVLKNNVFGIQRRLYMISETQDKENPNYTKLTTIYPDFVNGGIGYVTVDIMCKMDGDSIVVHKDADVTNDGRGRIRNIEIKTECSQDGISTRNYQYNWKGGSLESIFVTEICVDGGKRKYELNSNINPLFDIIMGN